MHSISSTEFINKNSVKFGSDLVAWTGSFNRTQNFKVDESIQMKTTVISNIGDLHSAVRSLHLEWKTIDFWWRGISEIRHKLVPGARRNSCSRLHEQDLANRFIRAAYTRYPNCPSSTEIAEDPRWLFLMQHYRLKTRLLDWTESPLIGALFSVQRNYSEDGVLWALNPWVLNEKQANQKAILDVSKSRITTQAPFRKLFEKQADEDIDKVIAINTQQRDIRMLVQQSTFTMHGSGKPLEEYDGAEEFLRKYTIPAGSKKEFWLSLQQLGIKESFLFPDLDHLAKELNSLFAPPNQEL